MNQQMKKEEMSQEGDFPIDETPEAERAVVKAAKDMGATEILDKDKLAAAELKDSSTIDDEVQDAFRKAASTKDVIGTGKIVFHPELPQIDFKDLIGHEILLMQILMVEGWDGYYGTSNFGLILVQLRDGRKGTSLAGGVAVVKQLRAFIGKRRFPVKVTLTEKPGGSGPYYLFE